MPLAPESISLSQRGYDYLFNSILEGKLQPGDEIVRKQVASELGVSLAPINDAVAKLEAEGFVEISPRRLTRVRVVQREEVRGLLILREAMECQGARLYCGAPIRSNLAALSKAASAVDKTKPGTRENELAEVTFHTALIDLVDCPLLTREFQKVMQRRLFYKINMISPWQRQPPLDNHQALLKRLMTTDPEIAATAMRRHLERGREEILK